MLGLTNPAAAQIELDSSGRIGIGSATPSSTYQFDLTTSLSVGLRVSNNYASSTGYGIRIASQGSATTNYGLYTEAESAGTNTAVYASADDGTSSYGVNAVASASTNAYGVRASAQGNSIAYGLWASATGATSTYAAYFNGSTFANGGTYQGSDGRLKKNIVTLSRRASLENVMRLSPKTYEYLLPGEVDALGFPDMQLPEGQQIGLVAQEVQEIFPNAVRSVTHVGFDDDGVMNGRTMDALAVNYTELIPVLIAVIQEQQAQIEALQAAVRGAGIDLPESAGQN